jgi:hypothetical protein
MISHIGMRGTKKQTRGLRDVYKLVADEVAAPAGEDGRSAGEKCALLLAFAGRRTSESEAVRQHAENDRGVAAAGRLANQGRKCLPSAIGP